MSDSAVNKSVFTLYEVAHSIQKTIADRYTSAFWVKAEMNKLNFYSHSGHCYPELVEKKEGKVIAQLKASLWSADYLRANAHFLRVLNEPLRDGIKILFLAKISFDPAFGLSLRIIDIDPAFTLGDLEQEKQETIRRLRAENTYSRNKLLTLPLLPKRIAIISVETSKGYADFLKVLEDNPWGYRFFHLLFPSLLQGEKAVDAMIAQLRNIAIVKHHFDAVAIIRGGGGDVGLSCYNHYDLAKEIALFPLPVLTGIGHATNETVCEMVSFANAITPTKMAEMLLQKFHNFSVPLQKAEERIRERAGSMMRDESIRFAGTVRMLRSAAEYMVFVNKSLMREQTQAVIHGSDSMLTTAAKNVEHKAEKLVSAARSLLARREIEVAGMQKNVDNLNPVNVLKRGFSISYAGGRLVKNAGQINKGDVLRTIVFNGEIHSTVDSVIKNDENE